MLRVEQDPKEMRDHVEILQKALAVAEADPAFQNMADIADWTRGPDRTVFVVPAKKATTADSITAAVSSWLEDSGVDDT